MAKWMISVFAAPAMALMALCQAAPPPSGGNQGGQASQGGQFVGEEWYDKIDVVKVNREDARSFFVPYQDARTALANEASALSRDFSKSSYYMSLNGAWKFRAVEKPADRIASFWDPKGFDVSGWDDIKVPSNWQTARNPDGSFKYDRPIYTNQKYPWDNFGGAVDLTNPAKAPTVYNPVGHYRRAFALPDNWGGRRVFVSFQGVESAFYLWVNGHKVGYAEDSFTASEFDITKYLQKGENVMAVQVYRWSLGSYLENQDFIRMSGIIRDVFLYSKADVELRDFFVLPTLNDGFNGGSLKIEAQVRSHGGASGGYTVEATLKNMDDTNVWGDGPLSIPVRVGAGATATATGSKAVAAPRLWFAEAPELYKVLLQLKAPGGRVIETAVARIGFRRMDIVDVPGDPAHQMLLYNGKRISLRGVNRHESSLLNGHAITKEEIVQDLYSMKRNNINAIRTSHYPNNAITYDLADELGLYVCDEANIESHAGAQAKRPEDRIPGTNPLWMNAIMDRTANMVERDKNHPSVIIWSLGNEATYHDRLGPPYANYSFYASSQYIKGRDQGRPLKYERDNRKAIVDIRSTQYPGPAKARAAAAATEAPQDSYFANSDLRMPYIMSEYSHSMGNAGGGFSDYWKLFREVPQAQGGFIWDYIDQSILTPLPDDAADPGQGGTVACLLGKGPSGQTKFFYAYGGDWGDTYNNDRSFCANGIMFADRTPKPFVNEIRHVYQEVWYEATEDGLKGGQFSVSNEFLNRDLSEFDHRWRIVRDGERIAGGALALDAGPLTKVDVAIAEVRGIAPEPGAEYFLELEASLKKATKWAEAGHVIARGQFKLPIDTGNIRADVGAVAAFDSVSDGPDAISVAMGDFSLVFDKKKAEIVSLKKAGKELIAAGPQINHWRHPSDNDAKRERDPDRFNPTFKDTWKNSTVDSVGIERPPDNRGLAITVKSTLRNGSKNETVYSIRASGEILVKNTLDSKLENYMLRVGMKLEMPAGFGDVAWYGRGPGENYPDRASGSQVGIYRTTTEKMFSPYIRPQHFGNRTGVRWIAVTDGSGDGLMIAADGPGPSGLAPATINACASRYDDGDFEVGGKDARHIFEVRERPGTVLNIDGVQSPIGSHGGFSTERPPLDALPPATGTYSYSYRIVPLAGAKSGEAMMGRYKK